MKEREAGAELKCQLIARSNLVELLVEGVWKGRVKLWGLRVHQDVISAL